MIAFSDWFPNALVGTAFVSLGLLKIYGWRKGIVGGGGQPVSCRLLGRCPSWNKPVNLGVIILFLAIGLVNFGILVKALLRH